jgi:hypothetical protein
MPDYDKQRFAPPAPLAKVVVRTPDQARSVADVPMLIDSGADVSLIPAGCASRLALESEREEAFRLRAFDGSDSPARTVHAELLFEGRLFHGRFLIIDAEYGVLGRNVLNHLKLLLDGPQSQWRVVAGETR